MAQACGVVGIVLVGLEPLPASIEDPSEFCFQKLPGINFPEELDAYETMRHLLEIRNDSGFLSAQNILDAAREKEHPLHGVFCWDDTTAAELHRRWQAGQLVRSLRVRVRIQGRAPRSMRAPRPPARTCRYRRRSARLEPGPRVVGWP